MVDPAAGWSLGVSVASAGAAVHFVRSQAASGNLGRNSAVGIRTKATKASDRAWKAGHAAAVPWLAATFITAYVAGAASIALTLALTLSGRDNPAVIVVPLAGLGAVIALLTLATVKANAAAREAARHTAD